MIAVDTNVPVRLIVGDQPEQVEAIQTLARTELLFVPLTVLLETAWVLRSRYGYDRATLCAALRAFTLLDGFTCEAAAGVRWAVDRAEAGADIADMLHIVAAGEAKGFATFDRDVAVRATASPVPILTLGV